MDRKRRDELYAALEAFFTGGDYQRLETDALADRFDIQPGEENDFDELLDEAEAAGVAVWVDEEGWFSPKHEGWIVGKLSIASHGHGYLRPVLPGKQRRDKDAKDIFVHASKLKDAHDRDLVAVRIRSPKRRSRQGRAELPEGRVVHVIRRSPRVLVGRFYSDGQSGVVVPDGPDSVREIVIAPGGSVRPKESDRVFCRLIDEPAHHGLPVGELIGVAREDNDYDQDLSVVSAEFDLPGEFPKAVEEQVAAFPDELSKADLKSREDYRKLPIVTIDPADARDFDDALTLEVRKDGGYRVGVFIADVAHYVKPGSPVDDEAVERATSTYLPGRVIPMLPERLSNHLCSLRPDVDRPAKAVWIDLDAEGRVESARASRGVICSARRYTYAEVQEILDGGEPQPGEESLAKMLLALNELRRKRYALRLERGALDLDLPSSRCVIDSDGEVRDIEIESRDDAHRLVEEMMLCANESVAKICTDKKIPILRRIHPEPSGDEIDTFTSLCKAVVPEMRVTGVEDLGRVAQKLEGHEAAPILHFALLRTLSRAEYSQEPGVHFALATEEYCHFTSPIRRYADLQVHRALDAMLFGEKFEGATQAAWKEQVEFLDELAQHCSSRSRKAEDAEREMMKLRVIAFLRKFEGDEFDGLIAAIYDFGFFVRLDANLAEGLVHVKSLDRDHYELSDDRCSLIGQHGGKRFRVGDRVRVELVRADALDRRVELRYVGDESGDDRAPAGRRERSGGRGKREDRSKGRSRKGNRSR